MPTDKWKEINARINKIDERLMTDDNLTDAQYVKLQNELSDLYRARQKEA